MRAHARPQDGYSLAEVMVALGLLAGVLVSVAALLVTGTRLVHAGRGSSEALEVARDIQEELGGWSFSRLYTQFTACDPGQPQCTVQIWTNDPSPDPATADWQSRLEETHPGPAGCSATIAIQSLDGAALEVTQALRIRVRIDWQEGLRRRNLELTMVRM